MNQYKKDFFAKLNFPFEAGATLLDVGCGDASDAQIFAQDYQLKVWGVDTYKHSDVDKLEKFNFKIASIYKLPFKASTFDYIFLHDVLHHVDEPKQRLSRHVAALLEVNRVCKNGGRIIIAEGNRFNPLFYPHMVLMRRHQHFTQAYFKKLMKTIFPVVEFSYFEAHLYPEKWLKIFKIYERVMESVVPSHFRAYNIALIRK